MAIVVLLILVVAFVVQLVLWSNIPRGIVVSQIEQQLGLRLGVKSLTTGWLGHTQLNGVTIGLPLADKAFLDVPVLKVKNTSLFGLLLGRPVSVEAIELDQPHLYVWQDAAGNWNLQEVAELLLRTGGKKSGEESAKTSSAPVLPKVHLAGGIVTIIDNKKRAADIVPLSVDGYRDTAVSWKYDIQIPPRVGISGRLVPGGNWGHEVAISLQNLEAWAKPWMADFPKVVVDATWRGALSDTGVGGRLELKTFSVGLKAGPIDASGALLAGFGGGIVTARPDNLLLKTGQHVLPELTVATGAITFNPATNDIKVDQLMLKAFGGPARIGAEYNLKAHSGSMEAAWERLALPGKITHSGRFSAKLSQPFSDQIIAEGDLLSTGNTPSGPWTATARLDAKGLSFQNFDWTLTSHALRWDRTGGEGIDLTGLSLAGTVRPEAVTVSSITLPNPDHLSGMRYLCPHRQSSLDRQSPRPALALPSDRGNRTGF